MLTARTEEGLPLVPTSFVNSIILSILTTAARRYPVSIIAFSFQLNHFHLIIRVKDPQDVSKFTGYLKQEIAHRINRLLGRRKKTIWSEGFDSPIILNPETVFKKIAYTLCNPVKDNTVKDLDSSPFVSSWKMFKSAMFVGKHRYIPRDQVPQLKSPSKPWLEEHAISEHFKSLTTEEFELNLEPYSWKSSFPETADLSDEEMRNKIIEAVNLELKAIEEQRRSKEIETFSTAAKVCRRSMLSIYIPKQFGKRMWCLAKNRTSRLPFIYFVKKLKARAREIKKLWLYGDFSQPFPPGLYPPGRSPIASIVPRVWMMNLS